MSPADKICTGVKDIVIASLEHQGYASLDLDFPSSSPALLYCVGVLRTDFLASGHLKTDDVVPLHPFVEVDAKCGFYTGRQMLVEFANFDESSLQQLVKGQLLLLSGFDVAHQPSGSVESAHLTLRAENEASKIWIVEAEFLSSVLPARSGYIPLSDLYTSGPSLGLYAVVSSWRCQENADGSKSLALKLIDSSIRPDRPVTCHLKFEANSPIPALKSEGFYVIRFHRISCSRRHAAIELYGIVGRRGLSLELWHCLIGSTASRLPCGHNACTLTEDDRVEVDRLRVWYEMDAKSDRSPISIENEFQAVESFTPGLYCNIIAKVICVFPSVLFPDCAIIRATDGTVRPSSVRLAVLNDEQLGNAPARTLELMESHSNLLFDVFAYGSHSQYAKSLRFAQYVAFFNLHLHYKLYQPMQAALTMHSGNANGRRIEVLDSNSHLLEQIRQRVQSYFPDEAE
ncbi:hypothetical protein M514_07984 [Trichuris suis]|uniref:Protection of telomeres protein 1 ssDNA-binding domain-containing protein n=1 Tax=Trichuris suis TaxID=68888 RepID=A0A085M1I8_9BILA|nr:hypothetical protein M513_07984 [Trichuris suis]KFD63053.1 hypothetical protein M514_07984 [Trichuris suis]KHJ46206.1 hypothetical protein D918_03254 [Trichuris suis]